MAPQICRKALVASFIVSNWTSAVGSSRDVHHPHPPPLDLQSSLLKQSQSRGVGDLFFFKHSGGEGVGGVGFENGAGALEDNGAGVVGVVHKMHGAAGDFAAVVEDGLVDFGAEHALAAKAGKKRGMDVDDSPEPARRHFQQAKPAAHADQIDVGIIAERKDLLAEIGAILEGAAIDDEVHDLARRGAVQPFEPSARADDELDLKVELTGGDQVQ